MKSVDLYAQVRFAVQIEGVSRREAARRFGIDPRTVAKMLAFSVPPGYRRSRPPARPEAGSVYRDHPGDPGIGCGTAAEAATHGEADLRTAAWRARLPWRDHYCQGLRAAAPGAAPRGVCAAAARSRSRTGGFWRGAGGDRRSREEDPLLRDG